MATARLAHELANLLDGSLRNVGLVLRGLRDLPARPGDTGSGEGAPTAAGPREEEDLACRLEAANQAMRQMATLIHCLMGHNPPSGPHQDRRDLGDAIDHAVKLLQPAATARAVQITVCISDEAARLPAGPIYPVIANALRNALEALAASPPANEAGHIEVVGQVAGEVVELSVRDNGPGIAPALLDEHGRFRFGATTKIDGHGLGLSLSRDIATALSGELRLDGRSPRGAVLTLRYPLRRDGAS